MLYLHYIEMITSPVTWCNAMQEYCRQKYQTDAVPVTSCAQLKAFYDWVVIRVAKNDTGEAVVGRS